MTRKKQSLVGFLLIIMFLGSCSYKNRNVLFKTNPQTDKNEQQVTVLNGAKDTAVYKHRIKPDDRILVNFLNNYDTQKENLLSNTAQNLEEKSFLVNQNGTVILPILGSVELMGLTRQEAAKKLEELYTKYIKNPIIDVAIVNLSVSVLGEVRTPGSYKLDKENTNLAEVLAMAGGTTDHAQLGSVKIIRGDKSNPEIILVNLRDIKNLSNSKLIIQANDIIYVEPSRNKLVGAPLTQLTPYFMIITSISSLILAISVLSK